MFATLIKIKTFKNRLTADGLEPTTSRFRFKLAHLTLPLINDFNPVSGLQQHLAGVGHHRRCPLLRLALLQLPDLRKDPGINSTRVSPVTLAATKS